MNNEVLIVGAGPSGLALAISLSNQRIPFRIIDKNDGPGTESRAMVIQARVLEFYQQFGFADKVTEKGITVNTFNIYKNKRNVAEAPVGEIGKGMSPFPYILTLPQDVHEKILVEELNKLGHKVYWGQELVDFSDGEDVVESTINTLDGKLTETFAYVCGCDGASSIVRESLGISFPGGTYPQTFFVADVENDVPFKGGAIGFHDDYFCVGFPVRTTGQVRLIGVVPEQYKIDGHSPKNFTPLIPYAQSILSVKINKVNWYSLYRVHHRVADKFREGRVFICGDAAHIHSPAGGQGMNTGISDALNLSWKIAAVMKNKASSTLLDTYEPERIKFAQTLVHTTDKAFQLMTNNRYVKNLVIPFFAPRLLHFRTFKNLLFKTVSQIRINYHESNLSDGTCRKIKGGDRLPWVHTDKFDNFAPLKSLDWQIHVYGEANHKVETLAFKTGIPLYNVAWSRSIQAKGIKSNSVFLIRPDGYISVATDNQNLEPVKNMIHYYNIRRLN
ncbi:monooxygenase [Staphylococcus xylosus]|uniref:FAD-dependent monooxygenase n=1 Tax=Staphylococcus TaxID=1279 RepID=UPI000E6797E8|nr:FAD-dependent monooxygenase [Staphylococcus xylosus]RIM75969.1 monooxygenase [Staphylococcus xylosus]